MRGECKFHAPSVRGGEWQRDKQHVSGYALPQLGHIYKVVIYTGSMARLKSGFLSYALCIVLK